jgi:hypothetical protein
MKHAPNKLILLVALLMAQLLFAQDIQDLYDEAKQALLNGDYQIALNKVSEAKTQIMIDPNLDPNNTFMNKLLPKVERAATSMQNIVQALNALYSEMQTSISFPDLPPTRDAVDQYAQQAKKASADLLSKRDSIFAANELDAEYRDALRNTVGYKNIEQLATVGIVEKLSEKFVKIASVLSDSLNNIDQRYKTVEAKLEKMKKEAKAGKAEHEKLQKQLAQLSEDRMNYMSTISEMLIGEATAENPQMRMTLMENNVENVYSGVILSEIKRVQAIVETDSAGYKQMMKNFQRIKDYNRIFMNNKVAKDQTPLLAKYEQAIKNVKITEPGKYNFLLYGAIALVVVILLFAVYKMGAAGKKTAVPEPPKSQAPPNP